MEAPWKYRMTMDVHVSTVEVNQSSCKATWKSVRVQAKHHGSAIEATRKHHGSTTKVHERTMEFPKHHGSASWRFHDGVSVQAASMLLSSCLLYTSPSPRD